MNSDNQVIQLHGRIKELENQNRILQEKVDYLTHKLFGSSSEQTSSLGIEGRCLFLMRQKLLLILKHQSRV